MEQLEFKILLEKFYEGNTSLEEEKQLREFLARYQGTDLELLQGQQMFLAFGKERKTSVDINFNSIAIQKPTLKLKRLYGISSAIAASLIIGLSLMFLLKTANPPVVYAYINGQPITDKEVALQQSKQALSNISSHLNKGTQGLNYMNKMNKPLELLTVKKQ